MNNMDTGIKFVDVMKRVKKEMLANEDGLDTKLSSAAFRQNIKMMKKVNELIEIIIRETEGNYFNAACASIQVSGWLFEGIETDTYETLSALVDDKAKVLGDKTIFIPSEDVAKLEMLNAFTKVFEA